MLQPSWGGAGVKWDVLIISLGDAAEAAAMVITNSLTTSPYFTSQQPLVPTVNQQTRQHQPKPCDMMDDCMNDVLQMGQNACFPFIPHSASSV